MLDCSFALGLSKSDCWQLPLLALVKLWLGGVFFFLNEIISSCFKQALHEWMATFNIEMLKIPRNSMTKIGIRNWGSVCYLI